MTIATERVVALPNGSPSRGVDSPPVRRTRTRARVTDTPRSHKAKAAAIAARRRIRSAVEVMYLDAADSWIVKDSTPSISQVWNTDYSTTVPGGYAPFRAWCRAYRYPAVAAAAVLDSTKWFLIHPVRGPLFTAAVGVGVGVAIH